MEPIKFKLSKYKEVLIEEEGGFTAITLNFLDKLFDDLNIPVECKYHNVGSFWFSICIKNTTIKYGESFNLKNLTTDLDSLEDFEIKINALIDDVVIWYKKSLTEEEEKEIQFNK